MVLAKSRAEGRSLRGEPVPFLPWAREGALNLPALWSASGHWWPRKVMLSLACHHLFLISKLTSRIVPRAFREDRSSYWAESSPTPYRDP